MVVFPSNLIEFASVTDCFSFPINTVHFLSPKNQIVTDKSQNEYAI